MANVDFSGKSDADIRTTSIKVIELATRYSNAEVQKMYEETARENYREQPHDREAYDDITIIDAAGDAFAASGGYAEMGAGMKMAGWACICLFNYYKENKATLTAVVDADFRLHAACALATGNLAFPYMDEVLQEETDHSSIATATAYVVGLKELNAEPPAKFANEKWRRMADADFSSVT